jgi:hypothetical protein
MNTCAPTSSPRHRAARRVWLAAMSGLVVACTGVVIAQYRVNTQVNRQIYGNTSSSVAYGRSYQPSYANNPTHNLLPSENRNLLYRSGALPSTIRMNHASVGPMAPQGVTAYVPQPTSFRGSAVTSGNYVNPMSAAGFNPMSPMSAPPAPAYPMAAAGSVRYASPSIGSGSSALSSQFKAPAPTRNVTPQSGSIQYSWKLSP